MNLLNYILRRLLLLVLVLFGVTLIIFALLSVFTLPKLLRVYFKYDRNLFEDISRIIFSIIYDYYTEIAKTTVKTGVIVSYQSFGDLMRWNPGSSCAAGTAREFAEGKLHHFHCIVLEGGIDEAVEFCPPLLEFLGVKRRDTFHGTLNAGHPGGMLRFSKREAESLHHSSLPDNLYVSDATLLPRSLGTPPILTIMALANKVSKSRMGKIA